MNSVILAGCSRLYVATPTRESRNISKAFVLIKSFFNISSGYHSIETNGTNSVL